MHIKHFLHVPSTCVESQVDIRLLVTAVEAVTGTLLGLSSLFLVTCS